MLFFFVDLSRFNTVIPKYRIFKKKRKFISTRSDKTNQRVASTRAVFKKKNLLEIGLVEVSIAAHISIWQVIFFSAKSEKKATSCSFMQMINFSHKIKRKRAVF